MSFIFTWRRLVVLCKGMIDEAILDCLPAIFIAKLYFNGLFLPLDLNFLLLLGRNNFLHLQAITNVVLPEAWCQPSRLTSAAVGSGSLCS